MRILFLGTPEFAVPSLEKLIQWKAVEVVGLVTQPDRPAGRGNNIFAPPTKIVAGRFGIPVLQPERLSKAPDVVQSMRDLKPDILVTVAFGQILKKEVLNMAAHGVMNVHGSLLPKYRGAAPINWAIINGETKTGVTTMYSDVGVDTGKMLLKREMEIYPDMNAEMLAEAMSFVGADVLLETLDRLMAGSIEPIAQNDEEATFAPRLSKEMGQIDWNKSAKEIHNLARGLYPWPGTFTFHDGQQVKIDSTVLPAPDQLERSGLPAGTIIRESNWTQIGAHASQKGALVVACGASGEDRLILNTVKPANKGKMDALSWANGLRLQAGACFSNQATVSCKD